MEEYIIWTIGILFITLYIGIISTIIFALVSLSEWIKEKINDKR